MINVTENTVNKLSEMVAEQTDAQALRIFVQGGGCAGFSYGFTWEDQIESDDYIYENSNVKIVIDIMSLEYLKGATIDYKEDFTGASFVIENPNAQSSCGCGTSFAPKPCEQ